jgi:hypothetical protein
VSAGVFGKAMNFRSVIGVHNGHNAAAAVVRNGKLSFALQEERLTRIKNQGGLPAETLGAIAGGWTDCDSNGHGLPVAFGGKNLSSCDWKRDAILSN